MKDKKIDIKIEGQLETKVESQNPTSNHIETRKSGGNTPSDLGAIKNSKAPSSASTSVSRSNLQRPISNEPEGNSSPSRTVQSRNVQTNMGAKRIRTKERNLNQNVENKNQQNKAKFNNNKLNPALNQNKMKNFGKKNKVQNPKTNPSASFFGKASGSFKGKGILGRKPSTSLPSIPTFKKRKEGVTSNIETAAKKAFRLDFVALFKALPIHIKIAIIGGGFSLILLFIAIIIVIATKTSAADGNRELKTNYIQGDYTKEELCEYLDRNGYINIEEGQICELTPAYQYFVNFKELVQEYESTYYRYRFQINVELLYETMAYFHSDEEMYGLVTKEEIIKLIDAMLEEIEESCVVKTFDKKKKICKETKYVYMLYEFSLNKYISYLKYGETSMHPNYGHDKSNKSSTGRAVERKCGEGKNVDYVFGYGLVNTSSSPLNEYSDCPDNPVKDEDYKRLPDTRTSLEELGAWGGVPKFSHIYKERKK